MLCFAFLADVEAFSSGREKLKSLLLAADAGYRPKGLRLVL